jgi:ribonuclease BN (tRNA processing enzyme)
MKLTVLGMYAPYPPAGCATSGYLLQGGGTSILLDCGSGVISRLRQFAEIEELSAVILSHLHGDHMADTAILRYMPEYRRRFGQGDGERVVIYAPPEPEAEYGWLCGRETFEVRPVFHGMFAAAGGMACTFFAMRHPYPCYGVRVECEGKVFAFTGDTVMNPNLPALVQNADLLLCDSAFLSRDKTPSSVHLSAAEAAALSRDNGVKRLILTHFLAHYPKGVHLEEARAVFENAEAAEEMYSYLF